MEWRVDDQLQAEAASNDDVESDSELSELNSSEFEDMEATATL
jgi:hypothetical protein